MISIKAALAEITARLQQAEIESPRREARLLLAFALGTDAAGLLTRDEVDPSLYAPLVARRETHEPMAYITGHKEFWGLDFLTSPDTLIPRPDTETLVEAVLASKRIPDMILDLGTGTGCLLLACLTEFPNAFGVGVDLNPKATLLAQRNAQRLGLKHRCAFLAGDWSNALSTRFDLILSNPPYIETSEISSLMLEVSKFEPSRALDGGGDGLTAYQQIIDDLPRILSDNGQAVLELGVGQATPVRNMAAKHGFHVSIRNDLADIERAISLTWPK